MMNLARKRQPVLEVGEVIFPLDITFDKVLKIFELWQDETVASVIKAYVALEMLSGVNLSSLLTVQESFEAYRLVFDTYIASASEEELIEVDMEGNPLPQSFQTGGKRKRLYSLVYDSDYIFAGFMQAYGIDLIEEQGKLPWDKFLALLKGLPESTQLSNIMRIRAWEPAKGDSANYKERMRSLQRELALPEDTMY